MNRALFAIPILMALLLAACSADPTPTPTPINTPTPTPTPEPTPTPTPTVTAVAVELGDLTVEPNPSTVPAGVVDFTVSNVDRRTHQFTVIKTDLGAAALAMEGTSVDKAASGTVVGIIEQSELPSGATANAKLTLEPGAYVLFCDRGSHYSRGMGVAFTVQ